MAEDPRELIRAAQAAELAKDFAGAAGLLRRAAERCRAQGSEGRAEQLERHAERLAAVQPEKQTGGGEPSASIGRAEGRGPSTGSGETAPTAADQVPPSSQVERARLMLTDRGPELADVSVQAWCSFCCHPSTEVGRLITGPTGAFICAGCVEAARAGLGTAAGRGSADEEAQKSLAPKPAPAATLAFVSHREAIAELERITSAGARRILLLGAPGVGKTRVLRALQATGPWATLPRERALLTEEELLAEGDARTLEALERGAFVLASAGVLRARRRMAGPRELPLPTTVELAEATGARLPFALLESVEAVLEVRAPTDEEVLEAARALLVELAPARVLSEALLREVVDAAIASGRPVHELESLIRRIPQGTWRLAEEGV